jgi:hypothetical protein
MQLEHYGDCLLEPAVYDILIMFANTSFSLGLIENTLHSLNHAHSLDPLLDLCRTRRNTTYLISFPVAPTSLRYLTTKDSQKQATPTPLT